MATSPVASVFRSQRRYRLRSIMSESLQLATLGLSAFISATLLPGTSEAALLYLRSVDAAPVWLLLTVASFGNVLGSCVNWVLGRYLARFSGRRWFPVTPTQLQRAAVWYQRWGWPSLLGSWLPFIGDPITVVAGLLRTPFLLFLVVVAFAKTARYASLLWMIDLI